MIDFHSHILPGVDDGSSSVEMSIQMLQSSFQKNIGTMVATPHFYASKESPEEFMKRRNEAWHLLCNELPNDVPKIYLGAEVYYYTGISCTEELQRLCIGNAGVILIEMPFHKWSEQMVREVISLAQDTDLKVLLAHIDRYFFLQTSDTWNLLSKNGILFQVNASAFLNGWRTRHRAYKLLREDRITVLGSDCHNMENRSQKLDVACEVIQSKFGKEKVNMIMERAGHLLMSDR
ncbi:MAG: hypothetical protein LUD14_13200 [Clostridiales bacterium]|nr:hypothetical protein [Clostridiales bacterium]